MGEPENRRVECSLDELILQSLGGNATPSVQEQVRRWRAESPENEAYYRSVALVWTATAPEPGVAALPPVDPRVILAEAERRREAEAGTDVLPLERARERRHRRLTTIGRGLAIAAGIAALAVSVRLVTVLRTVPEPSASYAAADALPRTVVLNDGSFVRLAAGSRIEVRVSRSGRSVTLTGRAFFAVAHDAARPFIVRAGAAETRVLGTRFEVAQTDGTVRTVVVDGLVAVSNAQGAVAAPAGSVAYAASGAAPTAERPADVRSLLDWPGGLLLFQGTPLAVVAKDVADRFGRSVVVEGETLQALRISGSFEQESFEEVVEALCQTAGARCRVTAEGAVVSPAVPRR